MQTNTKFTISNFFIVLSAIFLALHIFLPEYKIYDVLALHNGFIQQEKYGMIPFQIVFSNFLHGDIMHFLFNSIFIYIFGNQVERYIGKSKYILFFLFSSITIGTSIIALNQGINIFGYHLQTGATIGISGFALALLSFYTVILYSKGIDEYKGGVMAIFLNIMLGFTSNISFSGHLIGAISGLIFYFLIKNNLKKANFLKL